MFGATHLESRPRPGVAFIFPVAIPALGVVSAFGHGVESFWRALTAGESGLRPIDRFPVAPGTAPAAAVPPMVVHDHVRTPVGRRIDRVSLFALAACRLAAQDAGLALAGLPPARTGLVLGSAYGNLEETATFLDRLFA